MRISKIRIFFLEDGKAFSMEYGNQLLWANDCSGVIKILTDEGIEGHFIASEGALRKFVRKFRYGKRVLIDADPFDQERIQKSLMSRYRWSNEILRVLDACLWDIMGKYFKVPVYKLLGGYRDKIPAYASEVMDVISNNHEERVKIALECMGKGYKVYKIHPPFQSWKKDIALCKAIREAVGDDMVLLFDPYSHELYDRMTAIKVGKELERLNYYWYEDPLPTTDIYGLADLCRILDIEVLIGEYTSAIGGYSELIKNQSTDALRCEGGMIGGIAAMMKVAHLAEAFNMKCEPHSYGNTLEQATHLHVMLSLKNCDFFELPVPEGTYDQCMKDFIRIDKQGYVNAPRKPGLGYEIDWSKIERSTTKSIELTL